MVQALEQKKRVQTESLDLDFRCGQTHKPVHMCVEHKFYGAKTIVRTIVGAYRGAQALCYISL